MDSLLLMVSRKHHYKLRGRLAGFARLSRLVEGLKIPPIGGRRYQRSGWWREQYYCRL